MHELYRMLGSEREAELQATAAKIDAGLKASPRRAPRTNGGIVQRTIQAHRRTKGSILVASAIAMIVVVSFAGYAAASPDSSSAAKPYGIYKVSLNPADPDVPSGVWTLALRPGRYSLGCVPTCNPVTDGGKLKVEGDVLTFGRQPLCFAVGRYRWRIVAGKLRLKVLGKDSCSGNDRMVVLTSKPWTKQQ